MFVPIVFDLYDCRQPVASHAEIRPSLLAALWHDRDRKTVIEKIEHEQSFDKAIVQLIIVSHVDNSPE